MSHNPFAFIQPGNNSALFGATAGGSNVLAQRDRQRAADQRSANAAEELQAQFGGGGGGQGGGGGGINVNESRQQILDQTIGFKDQILNDSTQQLALDRLSGVVRGEQTPFNQEVRSSILSGAADQAANSAANQQQQILQQAARAGMRPNDPAVQARLRAVTGQQGLAGQQALQNLNQQANVANFGAQQQAANNLARNRLAQLNLGGQFGLAGSQFLQNDVDRQNIGSIQSQQFPVIGNAAPRGPTNVRSAVPSFTIPQQGSINVGVQGSLGGALRFDDQGRTIISGTNNIIAGPRGISEIGNTGPLNNQLPSQQNIGDFNRFGNTAIPDAGI